MSRPRLSRAENTSERLEAYVARTQTMLDLLALVTLWIVVIPVSSLGAGDAATVGGILIRVGVSIVYGVDMFIRCRLAPRPLAYARTHPIGLLAVILPFVRIVFSLRLVTSLFRRGHIDRFLGAAGVLLANGMLVVYFYERKAPGANIENLGDAVWWGVVTISTVGYGDTYPVTVGGRIAATGIMAVGVLTLAVITAEVSSSFVEQVNRRRGDPAPPVPDAPVELRSVHELHERLDRIEAHLAAVVAAERPSSEEQPPQG